MNIINASYTILTDIDGIQILKNIEKVGRVCYKSEDKITEDGESAIKFCKMIVNNHHEAMLEHGGSISVLFTEDRGVTHEHVRHRIASFAQESTRYCNYSQDKFGGDINVINIEPGLRVENKYTEDQINKILDIWQDAMKKAEESYMSMIEAGATPQMARSVLPQSVKADITITANIREWRHILSLRAAGVTGKPHPQMVEVMVPLLKEFHERIPVLFDDIYEAAIEKGYIDE